MNIKLANTEDFTITTKSGYTVTVPNAEGTLALESQIPVTSVNGQTGAVTLSIPTNTSDLTNDSNFTTLSEVQTEIVGAAPEQLNTLAELSAALNDDQNFASTVTNLIGQKYTKPASGIPSTDLADGVIPESLSDLTDDVVEGNYLPLTGGTMSGALTLSGAPILNLHAATKEYVDDSVFGGVVNESNSQYVKVDSIDNYNGQMLKVTIGSFSTLDTEMVPGLATVEDVESVICDNEIAISSALNQLNTRLETLEDNSSSGGVTSVNGQTGAVMLELEDITPHDYSEDYFTFTALQDTTFTFTINALQYSLDDGSTWTTLSADTASPTVTAGNKILWKQTGLTPSDEYGIGTFSSTGNFEVSGNIMSLYYGDNFVGQIDLTGKNYAFVNLFCGCNKLVNAENLILPATTLAEYCYRSMFESSSLTTAPELPATTLASNCYDSMFYNCTSLTTATELPATTLADYCYAYMFYECTLLTTAPELPATTLASNCYDSMFQGCTSLTKAPELSATTLADTCYTYMFGGCTSLTTAPELPATTLADCCYEYMFSGCTSLITAPELPVITLTEGCYSYMFQGCTSLTSAPELPATILAEGCYYCMFQGCTSLTTAPDLPATTLAQICYNNMFQGCTHLNYIKCLATNISASSSHTDWVRNVAATGTFVKADSMTSWTTGNNGIPTGWTVYTDSEWKDVKHYELDAAISNITHPVTSVNGQTGAVTVTETQLSKGTTSGSGNAVTDINVSNHQITLVKGATYATQNDIDTSIAALVNSAPATLDTLNELAAALGNDANFSTTVSTQIGSKISKVSNPTADNFASFNSDGTIKDSGHSHSDYITSIKTVNNESLVGSGNIVISGLPAVSSSDNGKILMVVNGQWQLVSPSVLYSGSGVPNNSNGNNGDIYIQTD